jgi:3-oxoacyl-[acyl-carrier-protein] synthase II
VHVVIEGTGSISALGIGSSKKGRHYSFPLSRTKSYVESNGSQFAVYKIPAEVENHVAKYEGTAIAWDRAVWLGVCAAREAFSAANWASTDNVDTGVVIGTSRGAVGAYESALAGYIQEPYVVAKETSPITTLGCFATAIASDLDLSGEAIDCSMTCSSGLIGLRTAIAWLRSGHLLRVLCGGAESALTPFTLAQMAPLGIYSRLSNEMWPCHPLANDVSGKRENKSSLALGEAACVCALEVKKEVKKEDVVILGTGVAREEPPSFTGISSKGSAFQMAATKALADAKKRYGINVNHVNFIVPHAAGTFKGDRAEVIALEYLFQNVGCLPPLFSSKWLTGHTFGSSGLLGIDLALHLLGGGSFPSSPYPSKLAKAEKGEFFSSTQGGKPIIGLVQAAGFGGTAAAVVIGSGMN